MIYYFAYGSNLHPLRLQQRVPSAELVGVAEYSRHRLAFHKRSPDGSGKCNMLPAASGTDGVYGAVYRMHPEHKPELDKYEGRGYSDNPIVLQCNGKQFNCFAYQARQSHIDQGMRPYHWYKQLVILGARYLQLPEIYIAAIDATASIEDPDISRRVANAMLIDSIIRFR